MKVDSLDLLQRSVNAVRVPIIDSLADIREAEQLGADFAHPLSTKGASAFPSRMRSFVRDLADCIRSWDQVAAGAEQLSALADAEELLRRADALACEAIEHVTALVERLHCYRELADPDLQRRDMESAIVNAVTRALEGVSTVGIDDRLDPSGFFVYILWGDEVPIYVGQSSNVVARLGTHMENPEKREATRSIQLLRCRDRSSMMETERRLIEAHRPRFNIAGNPDRR